MTDKEYIKRHRYCPYCTMNQICEISLKNNIHKCLSCNKIFTANETISFKKENGIPASDKIVSDTHPTRQATLREVLKCK